MAEHRSERSRCGPQASPAQLQCTAEQTVESESKPKILLVKKNIYLFLYQAKSNLKLWSPSGWSATRKKTKYYCCCREKEVGNAETTKGMKNQSNENPGYCCDFVSLKENRNSSWETSNLFLGEVGTTATLETLWPLWYIPSSRSFSGALPPTYRDFGPFLHVAACSRCHRTAARTTIRICRVLRQRFNQVSQNQISTFLRGVLSIS